MHLGGGIIKRVVGPFLLLLASYRECSEGKGSHALRLIWVICDQEAFSVLD